MNLEIVPLFIVGPQLTTHKKWFLAYYIVPIRVVPCKVGLVLPYVHKLKEKPNLSYSLAEFARLPIGQRLLTFF